MGKPMMLRIEDDGRLEALKKAMGVATKIQVLRDALDLLEKHLQRQRRMKRWMQAASLVAGESSKVNREFQKHSRFWMHRESP